MKNDKQPLRLKASSVTLVAIKMKKQGAELELKAQVPHSM